MGSLSRSLLFTGLFFIGIGVGFFLDDVIAGFLLGIGFGSLVAGIAGLISGGSRESNTASIVFGVFFALSGLGRLGFVPFSFSWKYVMGLFFLLLGIVLLVASIKK